MTINHNLWEVHVKGGPQKNAFEIAVIRANDEHGKKSFGWFDPNRKRLIAHNGGPYYVCIDDQETWDLLIEVAEKTAQRLNDAETA